MKIKDFLESKSWEKAAKEAKPGTPEWFEVFFTLPMTNTKKGNDKKLLNKIRKKNLKENISLDDIASEAYLRFIEYYNEYAVSHFLDEIAEEKYEEITEDMYENSPVVNGNDFSSIEEFDNYKKSIEKFLDRPLFDKDLLELSDIKNFEDLKWLSSKYNKNEKNDSIYGNIELNITDEYEDEDDYEDSYINYGFEFNKKNILDKLEKYLFEDYKPKNIKDALTYEYSHHIRYFAFLAILDTIKIKYFSPFTFGSQYIFIDLKKDTDDEEQIKIRFSDHCNQSVFHRDADFNSCEEDGHDDSTAAIEFILQNINDATLIESLKTWFSKKAKMGDWVDISRKVDGKHPPCGASADTGLRKKDHKKAYPKCVPAKKAATMTKKEKESAVRRKRAAERKNKSKTPEFVRTKI